jgi:hypothetical protein
MSYDITGGDHDLAMPLSTDNAAGERNAGRPSTATAVA